MLVVSDATPLNVLIRAEVVQVLPQVFSRVVIPPAVADGLNHERTPAAVREWLLAPPDWMEVRAPTQTVGIEKKGLGEREAIALAIEIRAEFLLADDKDARRAAAAAGLEIIGTLGTLKVAADRGLIALAPSVERLRQAGLFLTPQMVEDTLRQHENRGRP